jgi:hypothetical protein
VSSDGVGLQRRFGGAAESGCRGRRVRDGVSGLAEGEVDGRSKVEKSTFPHGDATVPKNGPGLMKGRE